ncbi:MAG: sulfite exporter TauE/SafE family protein [Gemmataceae bacterium]
MSISLLEVFVLIASAFAAGVVNSVAGGGTLLTFPALLYFGRLDAVLANATSTVSLVPASISGAWGFRRELEGSGRWIRLLIGPSIVGGILGSLLVTLLPKSFFNALVPWLLLTAALLFMLQPWLSKRFVLHPTEGEPSRKLQTAAVVFQLIVAIYGGYFGAGIGILMLSSLAFMGLGNIHRMNAIKTVLGTLINGTSVVIFIASGLVVWQLALPMAVGGLLGGYVGASVGRLLPKGLIRWFVILVGLGLAGYYFMKPAG